MRKKSKKKLRIGSAITLIVIGALGCLLPVMPGIPMLLVGIYMIKPEFFKKWFHKLTSKLPLHHQHRIHKLLEKFKRK